MDDKSKEPKKWYQHGFSSHWKQIIILNCSQCKMKKDFIKAILEFIFSIISLILSSAEILLLLQEVLYEIKTNSDGTISFYPCLI